jgi:peptidoglycan/LPS O-acetylase OafA/YrhL
VQPARSNDQAHLRYLDGWRGGAIALVLVGHFVYVPHINMGRVGVELFFVLSGRLMADVLFIKNYPLPDFFRRRIARVWPGLFVFVLIMTAVYSAPGLLHVSGFDALAALTFISNYVGAYGHQCKVLNHIWTLCIEEHSYLFLALAAFLARRRRANASVICVAAAGLCMVNGAFQTLVLHRPYDSVYWRTDAHASSILLACGLFLAFHGNEIIRARFPAYTPLLMGAAGLFLSFDKVPDVVKYSLGTVCFTLAICLVDQAPAWCLSILNRAPVVQLGLWSFSIYLWQQPFSVIVTGHHQHFLFLAAVLVCALASFYLVEQPARRYLNTHWSGKLIASKASA